MIGFDRIPVEVVARKRSRPLTHSAGVWTPWLAGAAVVEIPRRMRRTGDHPATQVRS
jgi:hypothetical protein